MESTFDSFPVGMLAPFWKDYLDEMAPEEKNNNSWLREIAGDDSHKFRYRAILEGSDGGEFCIGDSNQDHVEVTGYNCPFRE
jgi:hypothetical protein